MNTLNFGKQKSRFVRLSYSDSISNEKPISLKQNEDEEIYTALKESICMFHAFSRSLHLESNDEFFSLSSQECRVRSSNIAIDVK